MNNLHKIWVVIALLLTCNGLFAQIHYTAVPGNAAQVTTAIYDDFGPIIDIPPGQLKAHITSLIDPTLYCAACPKATLNIQNINQNSVQLDWAPISNADYYEIQTINLNDGLTTVSTSTNPSITLNSLDGAYAVSIVTYVNVGNILKSGAADIIILEMPALIDLGGVENCNCRTAKSKKYKVNNTSIPWNPFLDQRYKFRLTFANGTVSSYILQAIESTNDYPLNFQLQCVENMLHSHGTGSTFAPTVMVYLTYYEQFYLQFYSDDLDIINVEVILCAELEDDRPRDIDHEHPIIPFIHIYPNPSQEEITIAMPNDLDEGATIVIYDELGRIVKSNTEVYSDQIINIKSWPTGNYQVEIITNEKSETLKFLKIK